MLVYGNKAFLKLTFVVSAISHTLAAAALFTSALALKPEQKTLQVFVLNEELSGENGPTVSRTKAAALQSGAGTVIPAPRPVNRNTAAEKKRRLLPVKADGTLDSYGQAVNTGQQEGPLSAQADNAAYEPKAGAGMEETGVVGPLQNFASSAGDIEFGNISGPSFIYRENPVYPLLARKTNKEGKAALRLTISEKGALLNTEVIEDSGSGFSEAAIAAVKKSRYAPARRDGLPVASKALLTIRFVLK